MIRKTRKRSTPTMAPESSGRKIKGLTLKTPDLKQPHEESKEAEERYRRIFENSKDMFYATSSDGRHVDVNQTGVDLLGYGSREEMMQVYARDVFLDPADQKRFMNEVGKTGFVKDFETKLKRKDGTPIDVLITAHTRRDDSGGILGYEGIVKDISDRKRMEEELVQRAEELQALHDLSMLINQNLDLDRVIPLALEQALSLTAFEMGSIHLLDEEKGILDLKYEKGVPPKLAEKVKTFKVGEGVVGRAVELKRPVFHPIDDFPDSERLPILRELKVRALLGFPLLAKGKVIGGMVLLTRSYRVLPKNEISLLASIGNQIGLALENARLFSKVAKAKSEWETTFDAVTDLITIYGRDYRILRGNKAVFQRLGLEPKQVIGKKCHEIYYSRKIPCEGCNVSEVLKTEKPASGERESIRLKGVFQSYTFPIFDQARQVICVVNFSREVTEEKRLALEKEVVNNVNKILASNPDVKQMIQAVHAELQRVLGSERMTIALFDEERKGFHYLAQAKDYELTEEVANHIYPLEGTLLKRVAETGLPVLVLDAAESGSWMGQKLVKEEEIRSSLIFPLEYKEKTIGTMNFSSKKANHFSESQFSLLRQVAPALAISIQNAFLFEEMRQSEEKYRTVVEGALDGVCVTGGDYRIRYVNEKLAEIQGYRKEEFIGTDLRGYLDEESEGVLADREEQGKRKLKLSPHFELNVIRKDGEVRHAEISARSVKDSKGDINIIFFLRDITDRKHAEEALRRSEETARQFSQENAIMAEIGRIISSTLNIDDVYERFAEEVRELIPFDRISISAINSRDRTFSVAYNAGTDVKGRSTGTVVPLAGTLAEELFRARTKMLVRTEDLKDLTDRFPKLSPTLQAGIRSLMAIPLISKDEVIGVLHIQSTTANAYDEEDLRLAEKVGNQIVGAIANSELFKEWQQADEALRKSEETANQLSRENAIMAEIGQIISSTLKIDDVYERFAEKVREIIPFDRISINTINSRDQTLIVAYGSGLDVKGRSKGTAVPLAGTLGAELVRTRTKILVRTEDLQDLTDRFPAFSVTVQAGMRSLMVIPLISKDEVVGVLHIQSTRSNAYGEGDLRLAEKVGHQIAGAIANAELFKEWQRAEEALRKSEATFKDLYDNAPVGYHEYDREGRITSVNRTDLEMLGYKAEEMIGQPIWKLNIDEERVREQVLAKLAGTAPPGQALERTYRRKDGSTLPLLVEDRLILAEEGKIKGIRVTIQDITKLKQAEEALQKSEAEAKRLAQENELVAEIGRIIGSTLHTGDVYERFAEEVRKLIPFDRIGIQTINPKDNTTTIDYISGIDVESRRYGDVVPLAGTATGECIRLRSSFLFQTESIDEVANRFPGLLPTFKAGLRSMIYVPLISNDQVIGVLHIRSLKPNAYTESDLRLVERVGDQIAGAIANAQLFREWQHAEEALRESEKRFKELFDMAPTGYYELDTSGCITRVNQTELEMLGYTAQEMMARPIWDFLEEREIAHQKLMAKLAGALPPTKGIERTCIRKDGGRIPVLIEELILEDSEGRIIGMRSTMQNHTEFKQAQEALRRSEEAARRLAQENAIMAEIGRIISSTLNIHEVYERFAEEARKLISFDRIGIQSVNIKHNTTTLDYISGTDVESRRSGDVISLQGTATGECVRTRSSCLFQEENPDELLKTFPGLLPTFKAGLRSILVVPLILKDQVIGVIHFRSSKPSAYTPSDLRVAERVSNQIAGAIASAQLFIARQQAEEALKRNQEELIKKNKEIDEHRANLQLALEELERAYKELKATQSKILQQEKMASIGQLAAGVAHEINNPVAFISSNLGTLDKYVGRLTEFIQTQSQAIESLQTTDAVERLKQKQKELKLDYITEDIRGLIKESLEGSERVMKIVQGLKRFSRVDEADYKYADLNECIESTVNIVWNELKYKATLKKDYGKLPLTKCYPQQINQVFMNLLINAVHAIEKQGEITIKTWEQDKSIWAAISDTGRGIPKEHLSKIFEPFFTTKEVGKGTGLGLSITYEIVQKHNGEITVESEVGKGTTFTVRIPII